jgi:hypothetical protein
MNACFSGEIPRFRGRRKHAKNNAVGQAIGTLPGFSENEKIIIGCYNISWLHGCSSSGRLINLLGIKEN